MTKIIWPTKLKILSGCYGNELGDMCTGSVDVTVLSPLAQ